MTDVRSASGRPRHTHEISELTDPSEDGPFTPQTSRTPPRLTFHHFTDDDHHLFHGDRTGLIESDDDNNELPHPVHGPLSVPPEVQVLRGTHPRAGSDADTDPHHCHGRRRPHSTRARNQLIVVSLMCIVFMAIEIAGGLISHSLALVSDALHLCSDLVGFLISLFAIFMAKKRPSMRMSFGYYRAEVIGAVLSIVIIWVVTAVLVYLAVQRIINENYKIEADTMLITASMGVAFNVLMAIALNAKVCACELPSSIGHGHSHGGHGHSHNGHSHNGQNHNQSTSGHKTTNNNSHNIPSLSHINPNYSPPDGATIHSELSVFSDHHSGTSDYHQHVTDTHQSAAEAQNATRNGHSHKMNINVKAALVHVIGDIVQSVGVLIAAIIIKIKPEYKMADPICTFIFSLLVIITTATVLRDSFYVVMEAVPKDVDLKVLEKQLLSLPGVQMVHNLHVWALTLDTHVLNAHLAVESGIVWEDVLKTANLLVREKYQINHSTIQIESYQSDVMTSCEQCETPVARQRIREDSVTINATDLSTIA